MTRIFFALPVPLAIKDVLQELRHSVSADKTAVKWVKKENFHLTLQFIGDVEQSRLTVLICAAQKTAEASRSFGLEIGGTGVFPNPARPRILWAGITSGKEDLARLAGRLSDSLGIQPDKPFSPHLTLGRVRYGRQIDVQSFLDRGLQFGGGAVQVDRFHCLESTLTSQGPVYRTVAEFFLKKK